MAANTLITNAAAGVLSLPHILVVLVIVLLLFGGNRLRNLGSDLGGAIKGFKKSMRDGEEKDDDEVLVDTHIKLEKVINPAITSDITAEKIRKPRAAKPKVATETVSAAKAKTSKAKVAAKKEQE
jgi:sec-independent protein translocase protein TatA